MHTSLRSVPVLASVLLALCAAFAGSASAQSAQPASQPAASTAQAGPYAAAIASPIRNGDDRKGDERRKPAEFLAFAQVKPGMKAFDLVSAGGSTAALLTAAVGPTGQVWAQNTKPNQKLSDRLADNTVPNLHAVISSFDDPIPKGTPPLDLITINLNYHDIVNTPTDRAAMNKHLFDALKPGGHLVIIDNAAKKGSGLSATKTLHRIDEESVVQEVTRAGFRLDARSDYLRAPSDPREQPFFEMKGAPDDKFALRFVKP